MAISEKQTKKYGVTTEETDETCSDTFSKFRDPAFRSKFFRWLWLPCGMFTLGIAVAQGGATIIDLQIITDTDEEKASFFFTALFGGYMLGSFAAGAIHGKISNNIVIAVVTVLGGAVTIATPYCSDFILMVFIRCVAGFFLGCIDCSINSEHMHIWGNQGQALLQFTHFSFAIGGVFSPVFSEPFLAGKLNETTSKTNLNVTQVGLPEINYTLNKHSNLPQTTDVRYAYLIAGIILALTAVPFLALLLCFNKSKSSEKTPTEESLQRNLPVTVHVFMISILCLFYVTYSSIENTFNSYLEEFLVNQYDDVTKEERTQIMTYYWAAFAVGRFSSIFTSKWLIAVRLLYLHFVLMTIAFTGFLVCAWYAQMTGITAFTCLIGLALSAVYPAGFSWTEAEIMTVTGRISGVILVGSSVGAMISPFIAGYLMKHQSYLWFCYILVGAVVVTCLLFLFLLAFNRISVNKKYGTFDQQREQAGSKTLPLKIPDTKF